MTNTKHAGRPKGSFTYAGLPIHEVNKIARRLSKQQALELKLALLKKNPVIAQMKESRKICVRLKPELAQSLRALGTKDQSLASIIQMLVDGVSS